MKLEGGFSHDVWMVGSSPTVTKREVEDKTAPHSSVILRLDPRIDRV